MSFNKQETQKADPRAAQNTKDAMNSRDKKHDDKKADDRKRYLETEAKNRADKDDEEKKDNKGKCC